MKVLRQKLYSLPMTRDLYRINRILGKSPIKAKRAAINQQNKVIGTIAVGANKAKKVKEGLNAAALNPGGAVNKGTEALLRYPISTTSQITGNITMVTNPTGIGLIPIGTIGTGGEMALRKYVPRYARATNRIGDAYAKSGLSRGVESGVNVVTEGLKNMF